MRSQRFYDDLRQPVWFDELRPGEFAVLHVDYETGHHRSAEGQRIQGFWTREVPVFPTLDDAVAYASERVAAYPSLECRIFAAGGSPTEPVRPIVNETDVANLSPQKAQRRMVWGIVLIVLGLVGFYVDWLYGWFYILGVIIGVKFLTVGIVRLGEGISRVFAGTRHRRKPAARSSHE